MTLFVFGLSHKTADLALRERIAVSAAEMGVVLSGFLKGSSINELALLSTCNRTEFLVSASNHSLALDEIKQWLESRFPSGTQTDEVCYCHRDQDAVRHMIRVSAGLDSMVLGEPQIFGQMKTAYAQAVEHQTVQQELHRVFSHVFSVSKKVRSDTGIGANPVSVASAAVRLSKRVFSSLDDCNALMIGAGETIALAAKHLQRESIGSLVVANRTLDNALQVADDVGGQAITLANIPAAMQNADIVITSTASQLPVIGKGMVEQALKVRKNRPIFIVDIAVPRDVEEQVAELDNVYLYTIDDLQGIVEGNIQERASEAALAEQMIEASLADYAASVAERAGAQRVMVYRKQAEALRDQELAKALAAIESGKPAADVISMLAKTLTNKLIHAPSVSIKQATAANDTEKLQWAEQLLGIATAKDPSASAAADEDK
ncbi:MAG: glutamyl-tRNA reductase [Pseudomonadales bacterium]